MKRKARDRSLSPLMTEDVAALRRLVVMLERKGRLTAGVLAGVIRRIADRLDVEGGDQIVTIPGGEIRINSPMTEDQVADLKQRWIKSYERGRDAAR